MSKSRRYEKQEDLTKEERLLDQIRLAGRQGQHRPGNYHPTKRKSGKRKDTKQELSKQRKDYNQKEQDNE